MQRMSTFSTACALSAIALMLMSATAGAVDLAIWNANANAPTQQWYRNTFEPAFEEAFPEISLDVSFPTFNEFYDQFVIASAGGIPPDVVTANNAFLYTNGLLMRLNPLLEQWPKAEGFVGRSLQMITYDGDIYGLPLSLAPRTYVYNRELFDTAGLDSDQPPTTWQGYAEAMPRLTRMEEGRVTQGGTTTSLAELGGIDGFILQNGGRVIYSDGRAAFAETEAVEALEFWADLFRTYSPPGAGTPVLRSGQLATLPFAQSRVFDNMMESSPELLDQLAVAPVPLQNEEPVALLFGAPLGIAAATQHPQEAWDLLAFHFRPDLLMGYNAATGFIPPLRDAIAPGLFTARPWLEDYLRITELYGHPVWAYGSPQAQLVRPILREAANTVYRGESPARTALEQAARAWDQVVADNPPLPLD